MSTKTTISWATKTWGPTIGCSRDEDPGCDHCYAMFLAHRGMCEAHRGLTILRPKTAARPGVDWNGKVKALADRLDDPLRWRRPERVFVNSMSDLFHHRVPDSFVDRVFTTMQRCPHHTFLVLTKRVARCRDYSRAWIDRHGAALRNVQLGFSASSQPIWDKKAPLYVPTASAVRWASLEPLLGPIDVRAYLHELDWVVVGGESGNRARPCDIEWILSIVDQCRIAGVPVFVKQLGRFPHYRGFRLHTNDKKGEDMSAWHESLRVRQYPVAVAA